MSEREELISEIRELLDRLEDDNTTTHPPSELRDLVTDCFVSEAPDDKDGDYFVVPNNNSPESRNCGRLDNSQRFKIRYWAWKDNTNFDRPYLLVDDTEVNNE